MLTIQQTLNLVALFSLISAFAAAWVFYHLGQRSLAKEAKKRSVKFDLQLAMARRNRNAGELFDQDDI